MSNDCIDNVPRWTHEADMARMERINFKQFIIIAILVVACAVLGVTLYLQNDKATQALQKNNEKWIEMWSQYDFESYEYQQDGEGLNIIGDRNGVDYYRPEVQSSETD